jgi:hypothetical protein
LGCKVDGFAGPFFAVVAQESNFLRRHTHHLHHGTLCGNVDLIKEKLTNPKRLVVEIPDVNK